MARSSVAPARLCAYRVIRRVFEHGAYTDRALAAEAAGLDERDRALAMRLAYGTVQRRMTLDAIAQQLADRSLRRLHPGVQAALRLGLYQLLFAHGVAEHAAVNETVELAKPLGTGAAAFLNAVLRRAAREAGALLDGLGDETPAAAAVKHSVPDWLAQQLWQELGPDQARALLQACNEPAESALRVNTLVATAAEVAAALPVPVRPAPGIPEGLVLSGPFDIRGSALWLRGAIMGQSRGSMAVARAVDPQPGERVLDLCAAPGAKTTHLAALIADRGEIVAVERHPGRARALAQTCERMHARSVRVERADAARRRSGSLFDRVLLDPPCSGLGTLQSRPDIRWRTGPTQIAQLAQSQRRMLEAAAGATAPQGLLVYSVCTISAAETTGVIETFLDHHPDFALEEATQVLPHRERTDGFYIGRLRRTSTLRAR